MRTRTRCFTTLLAGLGASAAMAMAPVAAAAPQCTNTGPNTTQCQTNGSAQIVTSPSQNNYWNGNPFYGGGFIIGLGGFGW